MVVSVKKALSGELDLVIPWLRSLGFAISFPKCQCSVFTRSRGNLSDLTLSIEGHDLPCLSEIKYLGVNLDRRLT